MSCLQYFGILFLQMASSRSVSSPPHLSLRAREVIISASTAPKPTLLCSNVAPMTFSSGVCRSAIRMMARYKAFLLVLTRFCR